MTIEQIVTIPAGSQGIDYAWWRPTPTDLAPWQYIVRYACKLPNGKALTTDEITQAHANGKAVVIVWEQGASDWQQGSVKGAEHGPLAAQFAASVGYPQGLPIAFAFDTNAAPGDARARAYGAAAADAVEAAGYAFGIYGDLDVIQVLQDRSRLNWLAGATSWSDPTKPYQPETMPGYELCHVRQVLDGSTSNYDRNTTLRPFPAWLPHEATDVKPQPPIITGDDTMKAFTHNFTLNGDPPGFHFWGLMDNGTKRPLNGVELDVILQQRAGAPALDEGQLAQIPDYVPVAGPSVTAPTKFNITLSGTAQA